MEILILSIWSTDGCHVSIQQDINTSLDRKTILVICEVYDRYINQYVIWQEYDRHIPILNFLVFQMRDIPVYTFLILYIDVRTRHRTYFRAKVYTGHGMYLDIDLGPRYTITSYKFPWNSTTVYIAVYTSIYRTSSRWWGFQMCQPEWGSAPSHWQAELQVSKLAWPPWQWAAIWNLALLWYHSFPMIS